MKTETVCPALLQLASLPSLKQLSLLTFMSTATDNIWFYLFTGIFMLFSLQDYGWLASRVGTAPALFSEPFQEKLDPHRL